MPPLPLLARPRKALTLALSQVEREQEGVIGSRLETLRVSAAMPEAIRPQWLGVGMIHLAEKKADMPHEPFQTLR